MPEQWLTWLLRLAGVGQVALALASLAIPRVLGWREEAARLQPLMRQVFWTYAAYIWSFNMSFGLLSALAPHWLLAPTPLSRAVCGFIALYWGARVAIQLFSFRRYAPAGRRYRLAEAGLLALFAYLTAVFAAAAVFRPTA